MTRQKIFPVNEQVLLNQLEELTERLGIAIRYENIYVEDSSSTGGLCRIKGKYVLIVHSRSTVKEKIQVMTKALKGFDFSEIYIKPVLRELFEE